MFTKNIRSSTTEFSLQSGFTYKIKKKIQ